MFTFMFPFLLHCLQIHMYFQNFHTTTIVIQQIQIQMYLRYDVQVHTYIQTDTACIQEINVGLAQAHPNNRRRENPQVTSY